MRNTHALAPLALASLLSGLAGCGGSFNQGADPGDSGDVTSDGADGATDGATDGSDGSDGTEPSNCTHAYHPVDKTGWTKTFNATYMGEAGSATEAGFGQTGGTEGAEIYEYRDALTAGANGHDVVIRIGCNVDGEGMFVLGWGGSFTMNVFDIIPMTGSVTADFNPHRQYLPPEYAMGSTGSWSYSYQSSIQYSMDEGLGDTGTTASTVTFAGTYSEIGFESITLDSGDTVDAYKVVNEFTTTGDLMGSPIPEAGYIESWYVAGLGLVKEISYNNADASVPMMTKDLASYSGLVIE